MKIKIKTYCKICGKQIERTLQYETKRELDGILHDVEERNFTCSEECTEIYLQEVEGIDI